MTRTSLLALVTDAFGGRGGIAQYNRDFLTALADSSSVDVLPRHAPDPIGQIPQGVRQHRARSGRTAYAITALALARRTRPQVIFCGHLFMAPLAAVLARLTGACLIAQLHGVEAWTRPNAVRRAAVEDADRVLCVSRDTRARVLSWAALSPERVVVLPNTVSEEFQPSDRAAARARFGLGNEKVLLSVGRLEAGERYKGQDWVIDTLPELLRKDQSILYLVVGDGDDRARLATRANEHGISNYVRFLGQVPKEALPDLYRAADVFVLPSNGEGFGIVFLEAMACGTPALGLAEAGAKDALADGMLGSLVVETSLGQSLGDAINTPRPDAEMLAAAVNSRFGRAVFARRAQMILETLPS